MYIEVHNFKSSTCLSVLVDMLLYYIHPKWNHVVLPICIQVIKIKQIWEGMVLFLKVIFFFFLGKFIKYELCASNIYKDHLNLWIDKT